MAPEHMNPSSTNFDAIAELMALLREAGLAPRVQKPRTALPPQFDLLYGISVAALSLDALSKPDRAQEEVRIINATLLKFGQFIAARPQLVKEYLVWREHQSTAPQLDLQSWPLLPRGFLTDAVPDGVIAYLIALGEITRKDKNVRFFPHRKSRLTELLKTIHFADMFRRERSALSALAINMPTLTSLGVQ
ncbi:hypothetical protein QEG98_02345 [Myxococcus sp. MxC21-1]|uniref:hypothetical protein n=1 Tax=Myxococcus sp. MxC21-1 TaxID=3041439 RepID=UPI00292F7ECA|nr:hypothetical protein [Myxococcus sp. MxC21-1]WNZ62688.1 hypothetical protein QEG98_02345 [Myxococcus sp. MxC21-1]